VLALPWSGRYDFEDADFQDWGLDDGDNGAPAGQVKGDGLALSFVRFVFFFSFWFPRLSLSFALSPLLSLPLTSLLFLSLFLRKKKNRVLGAGHMVPMDQPAAALKMITAFTRGEKLLPSSSSSSSAGGGGSKSSSLAAVA